MRGAECEQARRRAAALSAEREAILQHHRLTEQHHHALAAHANALHGALAHASPEGLDEQQTQLLLATSHLLTRSIEQASF